MGDHRILLKVEFEMHGHKAKIDHWVNYSDRYVESISEWLREQIEISMDKYSDREFGLQRATREAQEAAERAEFARLKAKYEK